MILIEDDIIEGLFLDAADSDRKRAHYLLHKTHKDKVQRLMIALIKGSYVEPHYHELASQWEMFVVLQGRLKVKLYDNVGNVIKDFECGPGSSASVVEFSPGDIHSVECISERALMMEIKEGPFDVKYAKAFPEWATV